MDAHYHLAQKLNTHAFGAPMRDEFLEILHMLFTTDEADLALHLGWKPETVATIANKAGIAPEQVTALCESMANKGVLYAFAKRGQMRYALIPTAPGIFEYSLMIGEIPGVDMERLGKLWTEYYDNGWGYELHGASINFARVLPAENSISESVTVLPFEEAAKYIDEAEHIGLGNCPCRTSKKSCDKPIDVCLSLNHSAVHLAERHGARLISKEEARAVLKRSEEAGLVHCSSNTLNKIDFICNCCPCCCGILGAASRLKDAASRPHSNFYSSIDDTTCTACELCVDRCPMNAISVNGVGKVDTALCIGCGLCVSACGFEAIALIRKTETVPPADHFALVTQIIAEKGRAETFKANLSAK